MQESLLCKLPTETRQIVVEHLAKEIIPLVIHDSLETIVCTLVNNNNDSPEVRLEYHDKQLGNIYRVVTLSRTAFPNFVWNLVRSRFPHPNEDDIDDDPDDENCLCMEYPDTSLLWAFGAGITIEDVEDGPIALLGELRVSNNVRKRSELK